VLRHKLTDVALGDLLLLLNTFFPDAIPATKHKFYKVVKLQQSEVWLVAIPFVDGPV
jgi:hypothetical protein